MSYTPLQIQRYISGAWENMSPYTEMEYVSGLADALALKLNASARGAANGVAGLDGSQKLLLANFPDVIIDGMDRKASIILTGSTAIFDDILTANPTMAHGTAHKGDYWTIAHATANTTITITEDDLMDDRFLNPATGAWDATSIAVNPGDWIIFEGYFQDPDLASRYHWSVLNNNASNLYSPLGHGHGPIDISGLTGSRVLASNAMGVLIASDISTTKLGYLTDVTGNIQSQLGGKAPTDHKSTGTTYGVGDGSNYGHVKVINNLTTATLVAGEALSAVQGKALQDSKEPNITAGTTAQYYRGDKSWATLDKTAVGLGNVDNTADSAKVVASAGKWTTQRQISLTGAVTGSANVDGSAAVAINTSIIIAAAGNYYSASSALSTVVAALDTELYARPEIQVGATFSGTPRTGDILLKLAA